MKEAPKHNTTTSLNVSHSENYTVVRVWVLVHHTAFRG